MVVLWDLMGFTLWSSLFPSGNDGNSLYQAMACLSVGCPLAIWGARGAARHAARHAPQMGVKNSCSIEQKTCLNPW